MIPKKKISIIVPAYNVSEYIRPCLDSIVFQTLSEFEAIIVDDGSTDQTPAIIDEYARKDKRIKAVHIKNGGVSAARNLGIDMAAGDYFLFFDSDDIVEPYACEALYKLMVNNGVDTIIYGYHRYRGGRVVETCPPIFSEGVYSGKRIVSELLSRFVGFSLDGINLWLNGGNKGLYVENPALWRCMVDASVIRKNGLRFDTSLKVGEDTVFMADYLSCASRCLVTRSCFYYLVLRDTSTISRYEKDPLAKLDNKIKLQISRESLTKRIEHRNGMDIGPYWQGNTVMSCIELAFLLSKGHKGLSFKKRFRLFMEYAKMPGVRNAVRSFAPKAKPGLRLVPFWMARHRLFWALFFCAWALNLLNYSFKRS